MASPTQAVFNPNAPYQTTQSAAPSKPVFDPNASYEPASLPGSSAKKQWEPSPGDPLVRIQTSDGKNWHIHKDDLAEARKRDPGLKVFESFTHTPDEDARSRTLQNMTSAMSGQPLQDPDDQAEFEQGRKTGTIAGGVQIATGAAGGLFTPGVQVTREASSILGPEGEPLAKEVMKKAPSLVGGVMNTVRDALPKEATIDQATKIARIVYHLGIGTGGATFLWHELFGK